MRLYPSPPDSEPPYLVLDAGGHSAPVRSSHLASLLPFSPRTMLTEPRSGYAAALGEVFEYSNRLVGQPAINDRYSIQRIWQFLGKPSRLGCRPTSRREAPMLYSGSRGVGAATKKNWW